MMDKDGAWRKFEIEGQGLAAQGSAQDRKPKNHEEKKEDLEDLFVHKFFINHHSKWGNRF
jgi:hypothetical protein